MKQHTDPRTLRLLAEWLERVPALNALDLPWDVTGLTAKASVDSLIETKSLFVDGLPLIQHLHREHDWRRSDQIGNGPWWDLYAYIKRDGVRIEVWTSRPFSEGRLDGEDHPAIPFFAPPPPPLSRKKNFISKYRAWEYACHNDLW